MNKHKKQKIYHNKKTSKQEDVQDLNDHNNCPPEYRELYGPDFDHDRYSNEKAYRLSIGPSIHLWGEEEFLESLTGLLFKWNFPHAQKGPCVAKARVGIPDNDDNLNVYWNFDNNSSQEEFLLPMEPHDFLECYFLTRPQSEIPSWFNFKRKFESPLFHLDESVKLSNYELPYHACEIFKCVEEEQDGRWWITFACLNDPDNASHYDPQGDERYPLSFLLTLIVICKYYDPSTQLPLIRKDTVEARRVQKLVDKFTAMLSTRGNATKQMMKICNDLTKKSLAFVKKDNPTLKDIKDKLILIEAIILTMSDKYERVTGSDNWYLTDDFISVSQCAYELVMGIGRILLHKKAIDGIKALENGNIFATHLKEGSFVQFVECEDFEDYCKDEDDNAMKMWNDILQFVEGLKE